MAACAGRLGPLDPPWLRKRPWHALQEANPGGTGLPVLSPEELAMMRSGAAELRRLRKMGTKLTKHKALEKEVGGAGAWAWAVQLCCVDLGRPGGGGTGRLTLAGYQQSVMEEDVCVGLVWFGPVACSNRGAGGRCVARAWPCVVRCWARASCCNHR